MKVDALSFLSAGCFILSILAFPWKDGSGLESRISAALLLLGSVASAAQNRISKNEKRMDDLEYRLDRAGLKDEHWTKNRVTRSAE